jgi:hypothetical protein
MTSIRAACREIKSKDLLCGSKYRQIYQISGNHHHHVPERDAARELRQRGSMPAGTSSAVMA